MLVVLLAVSLVLGGPLAGVVVGDGGGNEFAGSQLQQETPTPVNDTQRHEDPDEVGEDGDLQGLERWLAGRMGVQLEECAVGIGLGETDVCEFEEQYPDWLNKYVDVAEETGTEEDDEQAETFEEAANETENLANETEAFQETREEYEAAREAGDEAEARRKARELISEGRSINETATELVVLYSTIERGSDVDLSEGKESLNRTAANVTAIVSQVETELFVETNLTATISPQRISFLSPGTVTGRLVTANGSPVPNEVIRLEVDGRMLRTETDANGTFSVEYRPTTIPVSADRIRLRYVPRDASVYLGSTAELPVSITQVEPTTNVSVSPTEARFDDDVRIRGQVSASGVGAAGVPLRVTVAGRSVGTVRTDTDGAFETTATIGVRDGPGEVTVQAAMPVEDRALAAAAGVTPFTIRSSPTALALTAEAAGPDAVTLTGGLETVDGVPVPGQPVTIRLNGTTVGTARTDANGRIRETVSVHDAIRPEAGNATVAVVGEFDGSGTNLEGSTGRTVVELAAVEAAQPPPDPAEEVLSDPVLTGIGVLGGLLAVGLVYLGWRRLSRRWPAPGDEGASAGSSASASVSDVEPEPATTGPGPLASARERLGKDADGAVLLAYAAVRKALTPKVAPAGRDADTHWEFLAACRGDGFDEDALEGLRKLTEVYEQAAFAPVATGTEEAETALHHAEAFV